MEPLECSYAGLDGVVGQQSLQNFDHRQNLQLDAEGKHAGQVGHKVDQAGHKLGQIGAKLDKSGTF